MRKEERASVHGYLSSFKFFLDLDRENWRALKRKHGGGEPCSYSVVRLVKHGRNDQGYVAITTWMPLNLRSRIFFPFFLQYVFPSHACRSCISIPWYSKSNLVKSESGVEGAGRHAHAFCRNSPTAGCLLKAERRCHTRQKKGAVNVGVGVRWNFPLGSLLTAFLHWE